MQIMDMDWVRHYTSVYQAPMEPGTVLIDSNLDVCRTECDLPSRKPWDDTWSLQESIIIIDAHVHKAQFYYDEPRPFVDVVIQVMIMPHDREASLGVGSLCSFRTEIIRLV